MRGKQVFLSLGSNLGDRLDFLRRAVRSLAEDLRELRVSSVYETAPLYNTAQPRFLNIAVAGLTRLSPRKLLERALAIEQALGRERHCAAPKGPRSIDVDLLLYDELRVSEADLRIPHPGMLERRFVLEPLLELEPELRHPASGLRLAEALAGLPDQGVDRVGPWEYTPSEPKHGRGRPRGEAEL
jgi:2-amino-4-hydroxy-6-hydroxymethyldihydropteridine diphosphokinase